jgi:MoxR-like ATPase
MLDSYGGLRSGLPVDKLMEYAYRNAMLSHLVFGVFRFLPRRVTAKDFHWVEQKEILTDVIAFCDEIRRCP